MSNLILKGENTEIQATKATCTAETDFNTPNSIVTVQGLEDRKLYSQMQYLTEIKNPPEGITYTDPDYNSFIENLRGGIKGTLSIKFMASDSAIVSNRITIAKVNTHYSWNTPPNNIFCMAVNSEASVFCKILMHKTLNNPWDFELWAIVGDFKPNVEYLVAATFFEA